jgi:predicted CoA-substrate-specific enzyme activase
MVQMEASGTGNGRPRIIDTALLPHDGNPRQTMVAAFKGLDLASFDRISATGRKFRKFINLSSISEPEAVEYAYPFTKPVGIDCPAIISAGGETFMIYVLDHTGQISNVLTGNKCASGTGEFFIQQLRRMDVSLEEAAQWAAVETPYHVSGRCSVFCKSDCTHATNKGVPKSKVTAGLCKMMAEKILELLKKIPLQNIMLTGGTALNKMMTAYLRKEILGLIIPEQAPCFEALGAALWAFEHETRPFPGMDKLFKTGITSFASLPPLTDAGGLVTFKSMESGTIQPGDICIIGLDVGSTTTKAILLRTRDHALLASIYLRTSGDPVKASRKCYAAIYHQIKTRVDPLKITIIGLGVCGSGRQIAGLHALTDGIINEIIAHAAAAVFFDGHVDTLFEIGGQDAKYTYITGGVPADYAMNEACSAGTGSFLEESALETLGIEMTDIADIALQAEHPPNFNDQCAAFIASDIKNAIHEGVNQEDIVAGLVYSICMNYTNRVKGNRPVGEKIFMQGGVCYNRAVPLAMATLVGKPIIVPPEPGLMGAFGVALEVKKRIEAGLMTQRRFDLQVLADREALYKSSFICKGGKEKCDRRCKINLIEIEGRRYPFGGACNRYYNLRHDVKHDIKSLDLVRLRQHLVFEKYGIQPSCGSAEKNKPTVGINRSFMVNTYYPFYSTFFDELDFEIILPGTPSQKGIDRRDAAFCYPAELAHGFFYTLLQGKPSPDFIFLPHFKAVPTRIQGTSSQVCPFVQGETYLLQTTFGKEIEFLKTRGTRILSPLLDLTLGLNAAKPSFIKMARQMGVRREVALEAFEKAVKKQNDCMTEMKQIGKKAMADLQADPDRTAVVIFARPYNGFVEEAHMGIPHKLASRGVMVLPFDFLYFDNEKTKPHMYWGMGQMILQAAEKVKKHPQLFGTYITNFSCGPDSFIIGYFRTCMGRKPSLTLELDSHTADAGIDTRIEAFLDIATAFRQLTPEKRPPLPITGFRPARTEIHNGQAVVITSSGACLPMTDPRVTVLLPSMGKIASESLAAVLCGMGFNAKPHPPADEAILKLGRANTSCKECLPLILTTGTLLNYSRNGKRDDEVVVYFMPTGSGPCRFGQYQSFMEDLIRRLKLTDVALFSLTSENNYSGFGKKFEQKGWWAVIVSDVMEDIRSMLLANAVNRDSAQKTFTAEWQRIKSALQNGGFSNFEKQVQLAAGHLADISLKRPVVEVPLIALTGEIFVRRDSLSRQYLTSVLAKRGFAVACSPVAEWIHYCNFLMDHGIVADRPTGIDKLKFILRKKIMTHYEKRLKSALTQSGLTHAAPVDIDEVIHHAAGFISPDLAGEAILTVGSSLAEIASRVCGVIAIGPFGCMPNRLSEALLIERMTGAEKIASNPENKNLEAILQDMEALPFLAIESDGSPFPQLINAKLETFCLRAQRLHKRMHAL